jgi:hypothetical protein
MNISNLIFALIVFIRERRRALDHLMTDSRNKYRREKDFIWVEKFEICLHDFITCWISKKHNSFDSKDLSKKKIRCKLNWQNKFDTWRRDFVWAQEAISNEEIVSKTIRNRTIDQILCILTIRDSERRDNKNKSQNYSDVLLNIKNSRNKDMSNEISAMIELNDWKKEVFRNFKNLEINRFYIVTNVIRSAHVVFSDRDFYYVNNYINWKIYNTMYDETFLKSEIRRAMNYKRQKKW